jgi:ribonuclease R
MEARICNSKYDYRNFTLLDFLNILKTYKAANYSIDCNGHFGLNLEKYTHFTSPIRRSFDIIIHKIINNYEITNINSLEYLVNHINLREKLNDKITRYYEKYYILKYLKEIKRGCNAIVIQVLKNGFRFFIEDLLYEDYIGFEGCITSETNLIKLQQKIILGVLVVDLFELKIQKISLKFIN